MIFKSIFTTIVIASAIILSACDDGQKSTDTAISPKPPETQPVKPKQEVHFLKQGLSEDDRLAYYFLSQGSQLLPYYWFIALENSKNKSLFRSANNMRKLGFIPHAQDASRNPDGLPIGFAKNDPKIVSYGIEMKKEFLGNDYDKSQYPDTDAWLGFTCANCHVSEMTYQGQKIRIDGGSAHADHQSFLEQLVQALQATTSSPEKMTRFASTRFGFNLESR